MVRAVAATERARLETAAEHAEAAPDFKADSEAAATDNKMTEMIDSESSFIDLSRRTWSRLTEDLRAIEKSGSKQALLDVLTAPGDACILPLFTNCNSYPCTSYPCTSSTGQVGH